MWWWAIAYCFYVFIGAYLWNLIHSQTSIVDGSCLPTMQCRFTCISIIIIIINYVNVEVCVSVQCKIMFFFTIFAMTDLNECASTAHNCDSSAACINTLGSFSCACNDGFYGNGISCQGEELYALHGIGASDWLIACGTKGAFGWYELEQDSPEQRVWLGLHLFWVGQNMFCLLRPRGRSRLSSFTFSQWNLAGTSILVPNDHVHTLLGWTRRTVHSDHGDPYTFSRMHQVWHTFHKNVLCFWSTVWLAWGCSMCTSCSILF